MTDKFARVCMVILLIVLFGFLLNDILKNRYTMINVGEQAAVRFNKYTGKVTVANAQGYLFEVDFSRKK
jgi:Na+/H+ antiporter NhaD/arsenite permease-like protein